MKSLLFSFNSAEVSYSDNLLNSVIQINERIADIGNNLAVHNQFNDFEKKEMEDRLDKLIEWNKNVQSELERQVYKLIDIKSKLVALVKIVM